LSELPISFDLKLVADMLR